jgi:predicted nucleic-acid-binding protein
MKGLDTNVLVRFLVQDDRHQAQKASAYIRRNAAAGQICYINHTVLSELVWVLESAYGYSRRDITEVLEKLLLTKQFEIDARDIVKQAINDYQNSRGDFANYLIGRINRSKGCDTTVTFDTTLKTSSLFTVLIYVADRDIFHASWSFSSSTKYRMPVGKSCIRYSGLNQTFKSQINVIQKILCKFATFCHRSREITAYSVVPKRFRRENHDLPEVNRFPKPRAGLS